MGRIRQKGGADKGSGAFRASAPSHPAVMRTRAEAPHESRRTQTEEEAATQRVKSAMRASCRVGYAGYVDERFAWGRLAHGRLVSGVTARVVSGTS